MQLFCIYRFHSFTKDTFFCILQLCRFTEDPFSVLLSASQISHFSSVHSCIFTLQEKTPTYKTRQDYNLSLPALRDIQAMRSGGHKSRHHFTKPPKKKTYISCHVSPFTATLTPQTPGDPLVRFHTILADGTSGNGHTRTHRTPPSTHGVTPACANREVL